MIQLDIYVYDSENENVECMVAVHKNSLDMQKWSYEVESGQILFNLQKLNSVIKVDVKCQGGHTTIQSANVLVIYTDKF